MTSPHDFDAFYAESRHRLLLQTWALTGDLPSSRRAVRDAYVVAWHRWSKVGRLEDPEADVRHHAWASAQRRSSTRPWHRERKLDAEVRATLDSLGKLGPTQRRVLVLSQLTSLSIAGIGRELGVLPATVERELQAATAQLSLLRGVPTTSVPALFEPLSAALATVSWPRVTILRRAGATRRRVHLAAGAVLTTAALVASGVLVTDDGGMRQTLETERLAGPGAGAAGASGTETVDPTGLAPERLVGPDLASRLAPRRDWRMRETTDNTRGNGLVLPCQAERYADPDGEEALVRRLRGRAPEGGEGLDRLTLTQMSEVSAGQQEARSAYRTTTGWFAGCTDDRVQLLSTEDVADVGEQATLFVLRDWDDPVTTHTVAIARTGRTTTTLVRSEENDARPETDRLTALLATAVNSMCGVDVTGRCAGPPALQATDPLPVGPAPGMLGPLDLPPAAGIRDPWVATDPEPARVNVAATRCDDTDFSVDPITDAQTRSFLVPDAAVPPEFGLTETVGLFPREVGAIGFLDGVRQRMAGCSTDDLGTEVEQVLDEGGPSGGRVIWRVRTELNENRTVDFWMGVIRNGRAVGQVGFVPAGDSSITPAAFDDLVARAQERLGATEGL